MKMKYDTPELTIVTLSLRDVILYSIEDKVKVDDDDPVINFDDLFEANGGIETP